MTSFSAMKTGVELDRMDSSRGDAKEAIDALEKPEEKPFNEEEAEEEYRAQDGVETGEEIEWKSVNVAEPNTIKRLQKSVLHATLKDALFFQKKKKTAYASTNKSAKLPENKWRRLKASEATEQETQNIFHKKCKKLNTSK